MVINRSITIDDGLIMDVLLCGFEGGISYWASAVKPTSPDKSVNVTDGFIIEWKDFGDDKPLSYTVTNNRIRQALTKMPMEHFNDIINENYDATTADVLIQIAVFKDVVFG